MFYRVPEETVQEYPALKQAKQILTDAGADDVRLVSGSIKIRTAGGREMSVQGVTQGTTVWLTIDAKDGVLKTAEHEAMHLRLEAEPGLRERLIDALGLSREQRDKLARKYCEAYEGCYTGEDLSAYLDEIVCDAYAGINRMGLGADKLQNAVRTAADSTASQSAKKPAQTRGPPEKYAMVGYGENGLKTYKSNFAAEMTTVEKQAYMYRLINNAWAEKPLSLTVLEDGRERKIKARFDGEANGEKFAGKMAFGNRRGNRTERLVTLNLADDIWEIASESVYDGSKDEHKDTEQHRGTETWRYFVNAINYTDAKFPARNGVYDFNLDVMERQDGEFVYTFHMKKRRESAPQTFNAGVDSKNAADANSSDTSIRTSGRESQGKFSPAATPKENDKTALAGSEPTVQQFRLSPETRDANAEANVAEEQNGGSSDPLRRSAPPPLGHQGEASETGEKPKVYSYDKLPGKARAFVDQAVNSAVRRAGRAMSVPYNEQQRIVKPALQELMKEFLKTGRIEQNAIDRAFDKAYDEGIEVNYEFFHDFKHIRDKLLKTGVRVTPEVRAEFADPEQFRRAVRGKILLNNEGLGIDTLYGELHDEAPGLFPEAIMNQADQLMRMIEVANKIQITKQTLDEAHKGDGGDYKRWAKNDFERSVENMTSVMRTVRRYTEAAERRRKSRRMIGVSLKAEHATLLTRY